MNKRLQRPGIVAFHLLVSEIIVKLFGWSLVSWLLFCSLGHAYGPGARRNLRRNACSD